MKILTAAANAVNRVWGGAHHGASKSLKDVAAWYATRGSAMGDLLPDLPELTYRSRDIRRNNGFAHAIVEANVENIVGPGLRLCSQPDYIALSRIDPRFDKEWAEKWGAEYESLWHEWWWSTACHVGDTKTGDMLCEEFLYSRYDSGGTLILPYWLPDRGDGFATKLKTVELDRLSNPNGQPDSKRLHGGIEFDDDGMPLAYWIRNGHPGDRWCDLESSTWERIPRRTPFGRLRVIHDFDGDRPDQTRGKPLFSAVLDQFKNIDRYVKAEIQAALMNAMIWGVLETPLEHEEIVELFKGNEEAYMAARNEHAVRMQAGTLATAFPGDRLNPFIPARPAAQFGVFVENIEKIIAVGSGVPQLIAKKDYAKSNYSNTRAAYADAWRTFNRRRDRLGAGTMDPINGLFMEEMVNAGRIEAPRFYEFRRAYQACTWIGPARGYVDKEKEANGDLIMLASNTTTLQRIAAEQGMHWKRMLDQIAMERAYMRELGLPEYVMPKAGAQSATGNAKQAGGEDDPEAVAA